MISRFLSPLAVKILLALIAALLVALAVVAWRADVISGERDSLRDRLARSEAQHAVTLASLEGLVDEMERMVRDGELRRDRLSDAMMEARQDADELRRQAEAIAAETIEDQCATPKSVMSARGL